MLQSPLNIYFMLNSNKSLTVIVQGVFFTVTVWIVEPLGQAINQLSKTMPNFLSSPLHTFRCENKLNFDIRKWPTWISNPEPTLVYIFWQETGIQYILNAVKYGNWCLSIQTLNFLIGICCQMFRGYSIWIESRMHILKVS